MTVKLFGGLTLTVGRMLGRLTGLLRYWSQTHWLADPAHLSSHPLPRDAADEWGREMGKRRDDGRAEIARRR